MTIFVLVHGVWHGGWCWGRVALILRAAGHKVTTLGRSAALPVSATIRVSAPPALATFRIAPHVGELRRAHPYLKLALKGSPSIAALDRGEADIAVRLSRPQEKGAVARKIDLYASIDYAARPPESWEFIAFDEPLNHVLQQTWLRQFLAGRVVAFEASYLFGQLAAAKAGISVAVLPTIMGECETSLLRLDVTPAPPERDLWLIAYPALQRAPAVSEVTTFLKHCIGRTLT